MAVIDGVTFFLQKEDEQKTADEEEGIRAKILNAALPHVHKHGWTRWVFSTCLLVFSCGSGFSESGSGSSISSESEYGSRSGYRVLMTKNWKKQQKIHLYLFLIKNLKYVCPSYRRSLQLWKENIQHFKKCDVLTFLWVIYALLAPDTETGTPLNPDPVRIHRTGFHILDTILNLRYLRYVRMRNWFSCEVRNIFRLAITAGAESIGYLR